MDEFKTYHIPLFSVVLTTVKYQALLSNSIKSYTSCKSSLVYNIKAETKVGCMIVTSFPHICEGHKGRALVLRKLPQDT